jgi:hypothetical protein
MFSRVCGLVSFRILLRDLNSDLWLCVSWILTRGAAQPIPARPTLAHAPLPWSFPLIQFSRAATSSPTSLSLSPRGALGLGDGDRRNLDPRAELLSLSLFFSPSPPLPSFPRARSLLVLAAPRPGSPARLAPRRLAAAPRPWPAAALPGGPARPCPSGPTPRLPLPRTASRASRRLCPGVPRAPAARPKVDGPARPHAPAAVRPRVPPRAAPASPAARPRPGGPAPCLGVASCAPARAACSRARL